eukprot:SAG22_NODE_641_length_8235_cov_9.502704_9_plen_215_part_00
MDCTISTSYEIFALHVHVPCTVVANAGLAPPPAAGLALQRQPGPGPASQGQGQPAGGRPGPPRARLHKGRWAMGMAPPPRQAMYAMLSLQAMANYITRGALAPMIQFIVQDLALHAAQKALLLGAFYPVFTPFQVVAGPLVQLFGGKRLLTLNLGGMAGLLMLLPACAKAGGAWAMSLCLAGIGICQGVLVPAQGQLKRYVPAPPRSCCAIQLC